MFVLPCDSARTSGPLGRARTSSYLYFDSISQVRNTLGSIAIDQREVRGRKVVVWISPGWPVNGGDIGFDEATELSTLLGEARITLYNINVWQNPDQSFDYHDYLEAPRSQKDMQPAKMALQVIATNTGGLVLDSSGDLDRDIERCVEQERTPTGWTNSTTSVSRWLVLP
jgi:hypothetical protein